MKTSYEKLIQVNVDVQNDFCPGGSLAVEDGDTVAAPLSKVATEVRKRGGVVVHTRDWHPAKTNHFADYGGTWPSHCVAGSYGARFHKNLEVLDSDLVISKGTEVDEDAYSGFQGTTADGRSLEQVIAEQNAESIALLIGGLATDYCDKATVLDAIDVRERLAVGGKKLSVFILTDMMKAVDVNPGDGQRAVDEMTNAGAIDLESDELWEELFND